MKGVKKLPKGDITRLKDAEGKAIKIISELLKYLPDTHKFKLLFMCRNINEIMASQNNMLQNRAIHESHTSNGDLAKLLNKNLNQIYTWIDEHSHVEYININYNKMLDDPLPILNEINKFLNRNLIIDKIAAIIDPSLYRQRRL